MRKSERHVVPRTTSSPSHAAEKAYALLKTRRGILGQMTRIENNILPILSGTDYNKNIESHYRKLVEQLSKLISLNTEYLKYENDPKKIEVAVDIIDREQVRLAEIRKMIDEYLENCKSSQVSLEEASFYEVNPIDSVSNVESIRRAKSVSITSSASYLAYIKDKEQFEQKYAEFEENFNKDIATSKIENYPIPPTRNTAHRPPPIEIEPLPSQKIPSNHTESISSCSSSHSPTPPPPSVTKGRRGLKDMRKYRLASPNVSNQTFTKYHNENEFKRPVKIPTKCTLEPADKFIDHLIEGVETVLSTSLDRTMSATTALRYEFESKNLPSIDLLTFNGDPSRWPDFIENFSRRVHYKLSFTDNDRMERLISVLTGEEKRSVEFIGSMAYFTLQL